MQNLSIVLCLKIGVTVLWFVPLLFFPSDLLRTIGFPDLAPIIFIKLLGLAYGSLLVGYVFGFVAARHGSYPRSTVWTGIVSNGGAAILLSIGAFQGIWATWGFWARLIMRISLAATGLISAGLIAFGPCGRYSPFGQRIEI
jgi:hypothetical protein